MDYWMLHMRLDYWKRAWGLYCEKFACAIKWNWVLFVCVTITVDQCMLTSLWTGGDF